ncbi:DUF6389 family protein [Microbacterium sp. ZW T5_45]|uniref:DUF6389 family protein n=1 Tax=Microbacterium sp. ZW T5_45 TaxID=3378080 RepID=UPI0038526C24
MTADDYATALHAALATTDTEVRRRLVLIADAAAAASVDMIVLDVFLDDDAEGPFDVWARFEGESVFVTQQRLGEDRHLVDIAWTEDGWTLDVPARPQSWSREALLDAIIDVVAGWLSGLIPSGGDGIVWTLETPDGETDPRELPSPEAAG